jgi:uncharacterized protein GlcG (DUF336 family)
MRTICVTLSMAAACASALAAPPPSGSGFPGDMGRPFDGLPLPPGPLPPRPPQRPIPRAPSLDLAVEAAKATVLACKGYNISVSVIDSAGTPKLYYVPDGTDGSHAYTGFRKADTNLLTFAGGMLLMAGDEIVGAIGVSGAEPSAKDEECGLVGINKIKDRLK